MSDEFIPGQNCPVPAAKLEINIKSGQPADFSCFRVYSDGKTKQDSDFVFYGQKHNDDNSVILSGDGRNAIFNVDLPGLAPDAARLAFAVTSDFPAISALGALELVLAGPEGEIATCRPNLAGREEAALILAELYRRNGQWKFRFIDQGFKGGLKPLAEFYGVDIADDAPPPAKEPAKQPAPQRESKISLSKITLTKEKPKIDLAKHGSGIFGVNLNWNQGARKSGFFGFGGKGIDLDLGAFVRTRDGMPFIIQALGETFGSLDHPPYVRLMGDDRTGAQAEGEWLKINGDKIGEIDEIIIYTFIYSGVPNWAETDARVAIHIPDQPEIETRLTEGDNSLPMCAIAAIKNRNGKLSIERLDRYFRDHREMDQAFGWGFRWKAGRK